MSETFTAKLHLLPPVTMATFPSNRKNFSIGVANSDILIILYLGLFLLKAIYYTAGLGRYLACKKVFYFCENRVNLKVLHTYRLINISSPHFKVLNTDPRVIYLGVRN
jgi:hypothetical protein